MYVHQRQPRPLETIRGRRWWSAASSRSSSGARWRPSFEQNDYSVAARDNSGLKGLQLAVGESSGRHRGDHWTERLFSYRKEELHESCTTGNEWEGGTYNMCLAWSLKNASVAKKRNVNQTCAPETAFSGATAFTKYNFCSTLDSLLAFPNR
jgi:hypothetical protein